jgi:hypothetical protein
MVAHDAQDGEGAAGKGIIIEQVGFLVVRPEEAPVTQNNVAADVIIFFLPVFYDKIFFGYQAQFMYRISVKIA